MAPTYRRLITQTSSLSGSSGSAMGGNGASPGLDSGSFATAAAAGGGGGVGCGRTKSPLQNGGPTGGGGGGGTALNSGLTTSSIALDSATVVSANSGSHASTHASSTPGHHHHHHPGGRHLPATATTANHNLAGATAAPVAVGGGFMNPAASAQAAAQSLQQAQAANAAIAAAHVQHHGGAVAPASSAAANAAARHHAAAGMNFLPGGGSAAQQRQQQQHHLALPQNSNKPNGGGGGIQIGPAPVRVAPRQRQQVVPGGGSVPGAAGSVPSDMFEGMPRRRGKWTQEEESYAHRLIKEFENGALTDCENGATLRSYLSRKLHCAPMRISKKFAGKSIGKHVFLSRCSTTSSRMNPPPGYNVHVSTNEPPVRDLELCFYHSLINESGGGGNGNGSNGGGDSKNGNHHHHQAARQQPSAAAVVPPNGFRHFPPPPPQPSSHGQFVPQMQYAPNQMFHMPVPAPQAGVTAHPVTMQAQLAQPAAATMPASQARHEQSQPTAIPAPVMASSAQGSDHSNHLRESFLSALKQSQQSQSTDQAAPNESTPLAHPGHTQVLQKSTETANAACRGVNTGGSKPVTGAPGNMHSETNRFSEASHAELPEFLSGFEQMASTVSAHMPLWPTEAPVNHASFGQLPPTPTFTSKSFDELHQYLGNGLPSQSFQLNNSNQGVSEGRAAGGPATDALSRQQQNQTNPIDNTSNAPSNTTPLVASSNFPAAVPQTAQFCADAYAVFAQQSAHAVSQHSAYKSVDHTAAAKGSLSMPGQVSHVVEDDAASNVAAKGWKCKARSAPDSSGDSIERPLQKRARVITSALPKRARVITSALPKRARVITTSAPPNPYTPSTLGRHASIISGSERSESESAVGSSRGSSSGSASDEADDNTSDNASDQSESGPDSSSAPAERKMVHIEGSLVDNHNASEMGHLSQSSASERQ